MSYELWCSPVFHPNIKYHSLRASLPCSMRLLYKMDYWICWGHAWLSTFCNFSIPDSRFFYSFITDDMSSTLPPGIDLCKVPALRPPPGLVSNFVNPTTLAPATWAVCLILTIVSVSLVVCRLYMNVRKLDLADCMLVPLFVVYLAKLINQ